MFRSRFAIFDQPGGNVESVDKFRRYRWPLITTIINGLVIRSDMTQGYPDCTFLSAFSSIHDERTSRDINWPKRGIHCSPYVSFAVVSSFVFPFVGNKLTEKRVWSNSFGRLSCVKNDLASSSKFYNWRISFIYVRRWIIWILTYDNYVINTVTLRWQFMQLYVAVLLVDERRSYPGYLHLGSIVAGKLRKLL